MKISQIIQACLLGLCLSLAPGFSNQLMGAYTDTPLASFDPINTIDFSFPVDNSRYFTKIVLINNAKIKGYIVEVNSNHLKFVCSSCVDPGQEYLKIRIPFHKIKAIKQKDPPDRISETRDPDLVYDSGCLDLTEWDCCDIESWDVDGCNMASCVGPETCIIASGVGLIAIAIILIVNEVNEWENYRINGDIDKYHKIMFKLKVSQFPEPEISSRLFSPF